MKEIIKEAKKYKAKCTNELCACEFSFVHSDLDNVYKRNGKTEYTVSCPVCAKKLVVTELEEVKDDESK